MHSFIFHIILQVNLQLSSKVAHRSFGRSKDKLEETHTQFTGAIPPTVGQEEDGWTLLN